MADETNVPWWDAERIANDRAAAELAAEAASKGDAKPATAEVKPKAEAEPAKRDEAPETDNEAEPDQDDGERPGAVGGVAAADAALSRIGEDSKAIESRLAELRGLRRTNAKRYWSDTIQKEELALTEQLGDLKQASERQGRLKGVIEGVVSEAPEVEGSFSAVFDAMPAEAQEAVRNALAVPVDVVRVASEEDLARFASEPAQKALADEWGRSAPRKLATLRERIAPMLAADPGLGHWFDGLKPAQRTTILKQLASG
jgi:hypothetical protein